MAETPRTPTLLPSQEDVDAVLEALDNARWMAAGTRNHIRTLVNRHAEELWGAWHLFERERGA